VKPIRFHSEAAAEFDDAVDYYDRQRAGLGGEYRTEVEAAFARLRRSPTAYARYRGTEARKCLVNRFPYSIYFVEFDTFIWIAAVAHQKRRQGYWMNRSPDDP
jgi:toxin ParE1/3/4